MRSQEEWQEVVNDLRSVLKKHAVAMHGSCISEGIYGEILLIDAAKLPPTNEVQELCPGHFFVKSVG
jgi:hypothetical protein